MQKDYSFIDICKLCALITKLQPFNNGNKRTAICFCNALLVKKNIIPIQVLDYEMYIEKLINYYENDKKIDDYVRFVCDQSHYFEINNKELSGNDNAIFNIISSNPNITKKEIAQLLNVSIPTISRSIIYLTKNKYINGKTSNKGGK
jgi:predicted HTH transcriptional regulator